MALNRHVGNRGFGRLFIIFSILCLIAYAAYPLFRSPDDLRTNAAIYRANAPLLFLPVWYFFMRLLIVALMFKRFKSAKELRAEREYILDEAGVHLRSEAFSSDINWSMFTLADCNRGYYFLRTGQKLYFYFPRSLVPDQAAFNALVESNVKCSNRWKKLTKA